MNLEELFDKHNDEFLKFERVKNKTSSYADVHAFVLLGSLVPYVEGTGCHDMVSASEHDEIYLSVDATKLSEVATEDQIIDLIRCGVRYDAGNEALCMFV